jgi:hypothetical protein
VFRFIYLIAVVMLSVLMVIPTTVSLAKDSHQKSSQQRRSSNGVKPPRTANVRNKSRASSPGKKVSKSSKNSSKASRSSRKGPSAPTRKQPAPKRSSKVHSSHRSSKSPSTDRSSKVRSSKQSSKIRETRRASKDRIPKRESKTRDAKRDPKVRDTRHASKDPIPKRESKTRDAKRDPKVRDTRHASKDPIPKRESKISDTERVSKHGSVTIPPSTKPDRQERHRPDVLGNNLPNVNLDLHDPNRPGKNRKRRNANKLEGIRNFDRWVDHRGKGKFKSLKLEKFHGKFGDVRNSGNRKLQVPQARQAKNFAIRRLSLRSGCHWWINFVIGGHWQRNHCHWWNHCYSPNYWRCWTPCRYQVVSCPPIEGYVSSSWYFGIDCILVPDMAAYGIQDVKPNSPAAFAGLRQGDLIVSINGQGIEDESVLPYAIQTSGGHLELEVIREGSDEPALVYVALQQIKRLSY